MNNENIPNLAPALVAALAETKDVHADSTNPFHRNKYASLGAHLEVIKPIFAKHGLAIVQFPIGYDTAVGVKTIIVHKSGESIGYDIALAAPRETDKEGNSKTGYSGQQAGAVISYLRRYALASVAGTATEDCDAETDRIAHAAPRSVSTTNFIPNPNVASAPTQSSHAGSTATTPTSAGDIDPSLTVPFGRSKGQAIGTLGTEDLKYWATTWEPRPYEKTGKVTKKDATLKATAVALYQQAVAASQPASEPVDDVPF